MTPTLLSLATLPPLAWVPQGLTQINTGVLVLGFAGLLLGFMVATESEDPTDMY